MSVVAAAPPASPSRASGARRSINLDVLKALAIFGVIAQHAIPKPDLASVGGSVWVRQAVTVFLVIMGLNATRSMLKHGDAPLRELIGADYWKGRFWRLGAPVLAFAVLSTAVGAARGGLDIGPTLLVGQLPYPGPGGYFITLVLTFAVVFPFLFLVFRAHPALTVAACFAVAIGFELAASQVDAFTNQQYPFVYVAALPRYLGAVAVGMWLARDLRPLARQNAWLWVGAPVGLAYLVWLDSGQPGFTDVGTSFLATGFPAACWAGIIVAVGVAIPVSAGAARLLSPLALIGQASFHIFLMQILVFRLVSGSGFDTFALALAISCAAGIAFYKLMPTGPPSRRAPVARAG